MTKFFEGIKTYNELKNNYRKLARKYHPDVQGGNADLFKAMKDEYDKLFIKLKNVDSSKESYTHNNVKYDFKDIIDKLIFVDGIDIEVIGSWIWVWGVKWNETDKHEQLKSIGLEYAKGKKAWCYKGKRGAYRKGMTKAQMREAFGSEKVESASRPLID